MSETLDLPKRERYLTRRGKGYETDAKRHGSGEKERTLSVDMNLERSETTE